VRSSLSRANIIGILTIIVGLVGVIVTLWLDSGVAARDRQSQAGQILELQTKNCLMQAEITRLSDELQYLKIFHELIRPPVQLLSSPHSDTSGRVSIELPEKVCTEFVRGMKVRWGDSATDWTAVELGAPVTGKRTIMHDYRLPPPTERPYDYRISLLYEFSGPWVVDCGSPGSVVSTCVVRASTGGLSLHDPDPGLIAPPDELPESMPHKISIRSPKSGANVGRTTIVVLESEISIPLVTLLVHPKGTDTYFVQPGARQILGESPESFEVIVGGDRGLAVGKDFDILVVSSDSFRPDKFSLETAEVPQAAVVGQVTVRKAAGKITIGKNPGADGKSLSLKGDIWTSDGGALLEREDQQYRVIRHFAPSLVGNQFDERITAFVPDRQRFLLVVCKPGSPDFKEGQLLDMNLSDERYWIYGPEEE
jgi:hypothetical protein